jgi:hypothetical protein
MSTVSDILEETGQPAEARDPDEPAEAINRLPAEDHRMLRSMLRNDFNLRVPFRRAISCAAGSNATEAGAVGAEPAAGLSGFGRNVAITPVSKSVHLKVQDALLFPRISDGAIAPMDIHFFIIGSRNEPKSW